MKITSLIETYLDGKLAGKELEELQLRLSNDRAFHNEVQLYKEVNEAILDNDIDEYRNLIKKITEKGNERSGKRFYSSRIIQYAAAACIIGFFGFWFFTKSPSALKSFEKYYKPFSSDISTRSVVESPEKIEFSYLLYQRGEYETAFSILENYLEENYDNTTAKFYYAASALELNKTEIAIASFNEVASNPETPFSIHAKWFLGMSYLKIDDMQHAEEVFLELSSSKNFYQQQAKKMLKTSF